MEIRPHCTPVPDYPLIGGLAVALLLAVGLLVFGVGRIAYGIAHYYLRERKPERQFRHPELGLFTSDNAFGCARFAVMAETFGLSLAAQRVGRARGFSRKGSTSSDGLPRWSSVPSSFFGPERLRFATGRSNSTLSTLPTSNDQAISRSNLSTPATANELGALSLWRESRDTQGSMIETVRPNNEGQNGAQSPVLTGVE